MARKSAIKTACFNLILVCLLANAAPAQVGPPSGIVGWSVTSLSPFVIANGLAPTAAPASISGQITITEGVPLAGATILLSGSSDARAITDSTGRYSFEDLEVGGFEKIPLLQCRI